MRSRLRCGSTRRRTGPRRRPQAPLPALRPLPGGAHPRDFHQARHARRGSPTRPDTTAARASGDKAAFPPAAARLRPRRDAPSSVKCHPQPGRRLPGAALVLGGEQDALAGSGSPARPNIWRLTLLDSPCPLLGLSASLLPGGGAVVALDGVQAPGPGGGRSPAGRAPRRAGRGPARACAGRARRTSRPDPGARPPGAWRCLRRRRVPPA